ncbi:ferredoxin reductase [Hyphomicrobium sp.]|uniref:ferredoxin reductase n=1 Tax=Hyphomicrobium sp. TaxID=82 RepID=UPI002FDF3BF0
MTNGGSRPVPWQICTIADIVPRTPSIKSFFFGLAEPFIHIAGQHMDVRLTASDGYVAMRSYSIASAPNSSGIIELAIERLSDGEVSTFFHDIAAVGDEIEMRGPLGGHFLWPASATAPVLLIGAGSGLVPLMAMIRQRQACKQTIPTALLLSSRTRRDVLFAEELLAMEAADPQLKVALAITREHPERPSDFARRIDGSMIAELIASLPVTPGDVFICGSNGFVDGAADGALEAGVNAVSIKTERYGG